MLLLLIMVMRMRVLPSQRHLVWPLHAHAPASVHRVSSTPLQSAIRVSSFARIPISSPNIFSSSPPNQFFFLLLSTRVTLSIHISVCTHSHTSITTNIEIGPRSSPVQCVDLDRSEHTLSAAGALRAQSVDGSAEREWRSWRRRTRSVRGVGVNSTVVSRTS